MYGLGAGEIFIIVAFALIFIGPKKLPELARNLGKGLREFQKAKDELMHHVHNEENEIKKSIGDLDTDHHEALTGVNLSDDEVEAEVAAIEKALNDSDSSAKTASNNPESKDQIKSETTQEKKPETKDS
jgi:sec-independent protein translocase protein TatA